MSQEDTANFVKIMERNATPVDQQISEACAEAIENNRRKLVPILSSILFCDSHDISLRGKKNDSGNFKDLLDFRVEAGDSILHEQLKSGIGNAKYTFEKLQNELIELSEKILRETLVEKVHSSAGFSILADKSCDISGIFPWGFDISIKKIFFGMMPITDQSAEVIANKILNACTQFALDMEKCIGQGYDGCSTMAGKEGGVQALIKNKFPKATFVHCSSHRLNLVVNY
ncbi:hypothetical protein PR048_017605 [Dryococelus australis]|uniref:DUF4371 domain-containing protein n=1 Tax=Dryococelus australis TaxID=614101 RepID=A0ABQ9H9Y9_9NEOP|nr:hypothetical protein PR048_017605 [Dryococelus australis]